MIQQNNFIIEFLFNTTDNIYWVYWIFNIYVRSTFKDEINYLKIDWKFYREISRQFCVYICVSVFDSENWEDVRVWKK